MKAKAPLAAMIIALGLSACSTTPPPRTVDQVDLKRYTGTWHEIARYPNWFQRDCAGDVTARYTARPDGTIEVVNSCQKTNGESAVARGTATVVPGSNNARLKVSFFGPFAGDYWILALDPDYQWALVGHPSRDYLWILSRDPNMDETLYQQIVKKAVSQGYDAKRIQRTPQ